MKRDKLRLAALAIASCLLAAGLTEAAIPLWQAAGELAFKRTAMAEAIAHCNQGSTWLPRCRGHQNEMPAN